jgi:hypothetical protein
MTRLKVNLLHNYIDNRVKHSRLPSRQNVCAFFLLQTLNLSSFTLVPDYYKYASYCSFTRTGEAFTIDT